MPKNYVERSTVKIIKRLLDLADEQLTEHCDSSVLTIVRAKKALREAQTNLREYLIDTE
jgi:Trp operon repressor